MKEIITIMDKLENISVMGNNEYKKWSKSTEKDGWCKKIKVEEIENGYLVCLEEYGEKDNISYIYPARHCQSQTP